MTHAGGRPTIYTPELAEKIFTAIATTPHGLKKICADNEFMPDHQTVKNWIVDKDGFFARYLEAKEKQAIAITENMIEEADNLLPISEEINRFTARFRFHQWHLSKLAPKQFGDKKEIKQEMNVSVHEQDLQALK